MVQARARSVIAVTGRRLAEDRISGWTKAAYASPQAYADALLAAGGLGAIVAPAGAAVVVDPAEVVASVSGVLLTGGADVDPSLYGELPSASAYGVDRSLDEFEIGLGLAALHAGVPLLAICRGMQVLNVALGGTLDQHITGRAGLGLHGDPHQGGGVLHAVSCSADSAVARAMGVDRAVVHSHHHQAVAVLAPGCVATAWSDDGLVEGFELSDGAAPGGNAGWCVAVQWHPEMTYAEDPTQLALFRTFVEVCSAAG